MRALVALLLLATPFAANGQATPPASIVIADPALHTRADALVSILSGSGDYTAYFSAAFRQAVPRAQFDTIGKSLVAALGPIQRIESISPSGPFSATLVIGYERGTASAEIALDPAAPHVVTGLRITGTQMRDDSLAQLEADIGALPGAVGFGLYELASGAPPRPLLAIHDAEPMPLASSFKLWVLAEAARQVKAGQRRWADVVPVGAPSLPSGVLQSWPAASPVTVQTLATQMISISDNTATDTLIGALGRTRIDATAAATGLTAPVLTTREAFVIKADAALTRRWTTAGAAERRTLLTREARRIAATRLDPTMFSHGPLANGSVEWFARPRDTARLLDRLRCEGGSTTLAILGVNHGADPATTARFAYLGYKGGSEPGVLTINFLARTKAGRWFALAGAWHRTDGETEELRFLSLMTRALALIDER